MKTSDKADSGKAVASGEFAGHVLGYSLGSDMRFELRNKKGKKRPCLLASSHPLFDVIADTVAHAHWADRKISVAGNSSEGETLTVHAVQVGDAFKPEKIKLEKIKKDKSPAGNSVAVPQQG